VSIAGRKAFPQTPARTPKLERNLNDQSARAALGIFKEISSSGSRLDVWDEAFETQPNSRSCPSLTTNWSDQTDGSSGAGAATGSFALDIPGAPDFVDRGPRNHRSKRSEGSCKLHAMFEQMLTMGMTAEN
jgi:hypothetical protein